MSNFHAEYSYSKLGALWGTVIRADTEADLMSDLKLLAAKHGKVKARIYENGICIGEYEFSFVQKPTSQVVNLD